jgi:hypothetical protein
MRRFAFLGALLLSLALAAPVEATAPAATTPAAWGATVSHAGFGGTVTVTAPTATAGARLAADLTGLRPGMVASLSIYGGLVGTNVNLVVRTRWAGSFVGGRWHVSVALTPSMWSWFQFEIAHRGGVHLVLAQGARATSAILIRK